MSCSRKLPPWNYKEVLMRKKYFESEQGRFYYEEMGENLRIVSYQGKALEIKIPSEISGKPVKSIGKKAFLSCKDLRKVSLPESIDELEDWAFANCNALEGIELPSADLILGKGVFQGCKALKDIYTTNEYISHSQEGRQVSALLASTVNMLESPHLFSLKEAGSREWLGQWDSKLLQFLQSDDKEGYTVVVLCGEEDYGSDENSLAYFLTQKRKSKVRLAFVRLLHPIGIEKSTRKELSEYLRSHTKGCESEESWQVVLEEHGNEKDYYEIMTECGCVTEENFQDILQDLEDNHPEMKAFLIKYKETNLGYEDFFDSLSLDL